MSWAELPFIVSKFAVIAALAVVAYGLGRALTRRITHASFAEEFAVSTAVGLGATGMLAFGLGIAGLFHGWALLLGAAILLAAAGGVWIDGWRRLAAWWRDTGATARWLTIGLVAIGGVGVVLLSRIALYPPLDWDASMYHVTVAKAYAREHGTHVLPYARYPVFPQLVHMLYTIMMIFAGEVGLHLVSYLCVMLTTLLLFAWGTRAFSRAAGVAGAALWISSPVALWLGSNAYIDGALTLFITAAIYCFWRWREDEQTIFLVLSGVLCGFAVGTKYTALILVAILGLATLFYAVRERRVGPPLVFGIAALLVFGPWFVRNAYHSGDPMFPFLGKYVGVQLWEPGDFESIQKDMGAPGAGKGLVALLKLPQNLAFNDAVFRKAGAINAVIALLFPLVLLGGLWWRRTRLLAYTGLLFLLFWFSSYQQQRYLLPIVPLLGLLTAGLFFASVGRIPGPPAVVRGGAMALLLLATAWSSHDGFTRLRDGNAPGQLNAVFWGARFEPSTFAYEAAPLGPPPRTPAERDAFLALRRPAYLLLQSLNEQFGRDYCVCVVEREQVACFADGKLIGDHFGPVKYARIREHMAAGGRSLYDFLRGYGVQFLLLGAPADRLPDDDFARAHFETWAVRRDMRLVRLLDAPRTIRVGPQLLRNPEFEMNGSGGLEGWQLGLTRGGGARLLRTPPPASVNVIEFRNESEVLGQALRVVPGARYRVGFRAWASAPNGTMTFRFYYFDSKGVQRDFHHERQHLAPEWREYAIVFTAREGDAAATIAFGAGPEWVLHPDQVNRRITVQVDRVTCERILD